ncbi:MAG: molybdenum cofactor biosynthesis protein MoaE [Vicinamibacterales bacterium]
MQNRLLSIGAAPLEIGALLEAVVSEGAGTEGAVATFLGLVRRHNAGRDVRFLEYEAYEPLALRAFERIDAEVSARWSDVRIAIHHRIGRLEIGEASVVIAAASPHRAHAFSACRYAIERLKQIAPIWKREYFEGGDVWIEGATADPEDADALAHAERVACA